ncbi:MAG: RAMP superfamily CRISPR-associated protein, partial [bacterium]
IPASSIRGMLRSFLEAATSGWVSEATPYFPKQKDKRQIGFLNIDSEEVRAEIAKKGGIDKLIDMSIPPLFPKHYLPRITEDGIDLCSFLFGHVIGDHARKGRLVFKNAAISAPLADYDLPDIQGPALMGGPNPSARSWWYQSPRAIRKRFETNKQGRRFPLIDFMGETLRGRKFYFHHHPAACLQWYDNPNNWPQKAEGQLYFYPVESLPPKSETDEFRIYFEEVPANLVRLLHWCLRPARKINHKLGYGKPYGFGSVEFNITQFHLIGSLKSVFTDDLTAIEWTTEAIRDSGIDAYLHKDSLDALARILYYEEPLEQIYTYPPFSEKGFLPLIQNRDVSGALSALNIQPNFQSKSADLQEMQVTEQQARKIAKYIAEVIHKKPALHFEVYQESANGYGEIQERTFESAL